MAYSRDPITVSHRLVHGLISVGLLIPTSIQTLNAPNYPSDEVDFDKLVMEARDHGVGVEVHSSF